MMIAAWLPRKLLADGLGFAGPSYHSIFPVGEYSASGAFFADFQRVERTVRRMRGYFLKMSSLCKWVDVKMILFYRFW
jgi:hypothetical protein